jgi:hypothetical protein
LAKVVPRPPFSFLQPASQAIRASPIFPVERTDGLF